MYGSCIILSLTLTQVTSDFDGDLEIGFRDYACNGQLNNYAIQHDRLTSTVDVSRRVNPVPVF